MVRVDDGKEPKGQGKQKEWKGQQNQRQEKRWRRRLGGIRFLCGLILFCGVMLFSGQLQCHGKELGAELNQETQGNRKVQGNQEAQGSREAQSNQKVQGNRETSPELSGILDGRTAYTNPETGYQVLLEDWAGLLTQEQLSGLSEAMRGITAYGNVAFVTTDRNASPTEDFAREYYMERFGTDSGTVFVIDMDRRNIWIHSDGAVWKVVTGANADTVADNVYRYASRGDYYGCALEAFSEIHALLEGERIARPMKYIGNAFLAMILALLANYGLVLCFTGLRRPGKGALLASIHRRFGYSGLKATHTHQTKVYDPVSSGSSGGGGGSSGGSSGGGGSRSGGGGGHKF